MSDRDHIVSTFKDGDTRVEYEHTEVVGNSLMVFVTVEMPILKSIDKVVEIHVTDTSPRTSAYGPQHVQVSGNVVGFTLTHVGCITTLSVNLAAVGF
ncbi:MAG: hypothetical protein KAV87_33585 [Desulfobacteraceae bacterium]|nr:hypothetical protein [Desulfobacteraceae bacterium]